MAISTDIHRGGSPPRVPGPTAGLRDGGAECQEDGGAGGGGEGGDGAGGGGAGGGGEGGGREGGGGEGGGGSE
eukprot:4945956-Prymnesium_polylepis.1